MRFKKDKLNVVIADTAQEMGKIAAEAIASDLRNIVKEKGYARVMFAAAPSQDTTLAALIEKKDIPWDKIIAFHMDEYIGITDDKPQSFRNYLKRSIFSKVPLQQINYIKGDAKDPEEESLEYGELLEKEPLDLIVLGVGENGHIAFNDPPEARFDDEQPVRIIKLSSKSRKQQVNDGCFSKLDDVPSTAITVTIPVFLKASYLHCVVPNSRKAEAIKMVVEGPISESCPASVLRTHDKAILYLDKESASLLSI